ncbi:hypothetical protein FOL47_004570 [Perkinsus chesapeaki]|uniref:Uncharacterized protein n=1 Tax=Perkinsus chesapeaki TaxID=330153 RepID=A0A7J6MZU2_PERCH|nr:hypothetical protein FOL47_004570 [Perkinsus chesapeaki]
MSTTVDGRTTTDIINEVLSPIGKSIDSAFTSIWATVKAQHTDIEPMAKIAIKSAQVGAISGAAISTVGALALRRIGMLRCAVSPVWILGGAAILTPLAWYDMLGGIQVKEDDSIVGRLKKKFSVDGRVDVDKCSIIGAASGATLAPVLLGMHGVPKGMVFGFLSGTIYGLIENNKKALKDTATDASKKLKSDKEAVRITVGDFFIDKARQAA